LSQQARREPESLDRARDQAVKCAAYFGRVLTEHGHNVLAVRKGDVIFLAARGKFAAQVEEVVKQDPNLHGLAGPVRFEQPPQFR
jgi:hypothetical protein